MLKGLPLIIRFLPSVTQPALPCPHHMGMGWAVSSRLADATVTARKQRNSRGTFALSQCLSFSIDTLYCCVILYNIMIPMTVANQLQITACCQRLHNWTLKMLMSETSLNIHYWRAENDVFHDHIQWLLDEVLHGAELLSHWKTCGRKPRVTFAQIPVQLLSAHLFNLTSYLADSSSFRSLSIQEIWFQSLNLNPCWCTKR